MGAALARITDCYDSGDFQKHFFFKKIYTTDTFLEDFPDEFVWLYDFGSKSWRSSHVTSYRWIIEVKQNGSDSKDCLLGTSIS